MTEELDLIEKLAKAATPGEWFRGHNENGYAQGEMSVWPDKNMVGGMITKCGWHMPWEGWFEQPAKDAAFIAAANPAAILSMTALIRQLKADNERQAAILRDDELAFNMIDVGQTAVPDHWRFRCDARKIAQMRLKSLRAAQSLNQTERGEA